MFTRELVSSLQFYQGQPGSLGIGEIVLTGGTAQLPGIDAELGRMLGVHVRVGDPLVRVPRGKKIPAELSSSARWRSQSDSGSRRPRNASRQPSPTRRRAPAAASRQTNPVVLGGVVGAVLATAILAAVFLTASAGVADNQEQLDAAQAELAATPVPAPADTSSATHSSRRRAPESWRSSTALGARVAWDRVLREVSLVLPEDVWLTTLSAKAPVAAAGDTRRRLHDHRQDLLARRRRAPARTARPSCRT